MLYSTGSTGVLFGVLDSETVQLDLASNNSVY